MSSTVIKSINSIPIQDSRISDTDIDNWNTNNNNNNNNNSWNLYQYITLTETTQYTTITLDSPCSKIMVLAHGEYEIAATAYISGILWINRTTNYQPSYGFSCTKTLTTTNKYGTTLFVVDPIMVTTNFNSKEVAVIKYDTEANVQNYNSQSLSGASACTCIVEQEPSIYGMENDLNINTITFGVASTNAIPTTNFVIEVFGIKA